DAPATYDQMQTGANERNAPARHADRCAGTHEPDSQKTANPRHASDTGTAAKPALSKTGWRAGVPDHRSRSPATRCRSSYTPGLCTTNARPDARWKQPLRKMGSGASSGRWQTRRTLATATGSGSLPVTRIRQSRG